MWGARMIDVGTATIGGIFYLTGQYGLALLLIVLAIISGAGVAVLAIVNPNWYFKKRLKAGLDVDFFNPHKGIASLLVTKVIIIGFLVWAAHHVASKAGYL